MNSSKQIKLGALLSYIAIAVNIVSGLFYTPWMIETIGKSQYGLYTLATSLITMFMVDFGLSAATGRYLSKYNAVGDRLGAERFLGAVYKLYMLIDAVIFTVLFVMFFFLDKIYVKLTPEELEQFKIVYIISGLFSIINFPFVTFNGILTAYEKFVPLKVADLLYRLFNIGFTVLALQLGYGLYALVIVHAAVGLLNLLIKFLMIKTTIPLKVTFQNTNKKLYLEIFSFSIWVTVSALALRLVFNITPSILGIVATGTSAIAVFGIVTTIEGYTYLLTTAVDGMFMPRISKILAVDSTAEKLNPLFSTIGKLQFSLNGLIIAGFAVVGKSFIQLWMGNGFQEAYYGVLLVLIPGLFYNSLQIANTTMVVMNKVKKTAFVNILTGISNVALSFLFSWLFGMTGACISICTAYFLRVILLLIIYHRELPLDIPHFIKKCYLRMLIPLIITIIFGFGINYLIADGGWLVFLLKSAATASIYLVFVAVFGFRKDERKNVFAQLKLKKK